MQYLQRPEGDVVSPGVRNYRKFLEEMTLNQRPEGSTEHVGTQVSDGDKSEREKEDPKISRQKHVLAQDEKTYILETSTGFGYYVVLFSCCILEISIITVV